MKVAVQGVQSLTKGIDPDGEYAGVKSWSNAVAQYRRRLQGLTSEEPVPIARAQGGRSFPHHAPLHAHCTAPLGGAEGKPLLRDWVLR